MEAMQVHKLEQGTDEWHQFRLDHFGASEAAAMLGKSKFISRIDLLTMKHTGIAKEYNDWFQKKILDKGHEIEAKGRKIMEGML
ncbi:MAG: YqaJ viral recombinase family protein, partial [Gammaproteobacteria bacterium]|nr:YqaJ viral recombinase family protein [Gammaproteobacteria bacterium]